MKKLIVILAFAKAPITYAQNTDTLTLKIVSTYIISYICKNGTIVVVSDSRSSFATPLLEVRAYYDGAPKLFQFNNIIIGMSGYYSLDDTEFVGLFNNFKNTFKQQIPLSKFFDTFLKYSKSKLSANGYQIMLRNKFIISGYEANHPYIYWYDGHQKDVVTNLGYKSCNPNDNTIPAIKNGIMGQLNNSTPEQITRFTEEFFKQIELDPKNIGVGGETSIIYITKDKVDWKRNSFTNQFTNMQQFADAYKKGLSMWYQSPVDSLQFRYLLINKHLLK